MPRQVEMRVRAVSGPNVDEGGARSFELLVHSSYCHAVPTSTGKHDYDALFKLAIRDVKKCRYGIYRRSSIILLS